MSQLSTTGAPARSTADGNRTREDRFEGPATRTIRVTAAWYPVPGSNPAFSSLRTRRDHYYFNGACARHQGFEPRTYRVEAGRSFR